MMCSYLTITHDLGTGSVRLVVTCASCSELVIRGLCRCRMNINIPEHSSSNMLHFSGRFAVLRALASNSLGRISAKFITWLDVTILEGGVGAYKSQSPGFFYLMVAEWARIW